MMTMIDVGLWYYYNDPNVVPVHYMAWVYGVLMTSLGIMGLVISYRTDPVRVIARNRKKIIKEQIERDGLQEWLTDHALMEKQAKEEEYLKEWERVNKYKDTRNPNNKN